jgi:hypothetical protein
LDPFARLVKRLRDARVRFVVIGVAGVNYYARAAGQIFTTLDRDLFLPPESANLLRCWRACASEGFALWAGDEPLGSPLDRGLADQVVSHRALVRAVGQDLQVDLSLVMTGFEFDPVWRERRLFRLENVSIPVASLEQIVKSKAAADRPKDRLFLASHEDTLSVLLGEKTPPTRRRRRS